MIIHATTLDQALAGGVSAQPRADRRGNLVVRNAMAQAALDGRLFGVANQAAVATTAALAGTWTGLAVSNPIGSNKNMVLHEFGFSQTVAASADGAIGLLTCTIAAPASAVTIYNQLLGGATSTMLADDGATIVGGILQRVFGPIGTLAVTGYGQGPQFVYKAEGSLIIPPGYTIATYTTKATTASMIFHFVWEEVPA
jgi:hypothetical protein